MDKISKLLHDDLFDSKDYKSENLSGRVEYIINMLKEKNQELDAVYEMKVNALIRKFKLENV